MRASQLFAPTLREDPAEADIASHRLLLRAGFIRQLMAGVYTTLPLGLRTIRRIEAIVREEMDAAGAQELRMPIVLPAEPWRATGRWELYGELLFRLRDRHGRDLLLGPTEEEVVTPLVASASCSYRDLPVNLYQIEWKYRDEYRPRFGLLRGREFLMKDAYSFDRDQAGLERSYAAMYEAYRRVFERCRLDHVIVEADPGQIGGGINHEFMARAEVGEDLFVECEHGDYLADTEAARPMPPEPAGEPTEPLQVLDTPDTPTIESLARFLGVEAARTLKCVLFDVGGRTVAVLVPGDREVSQTKLDKLMFPEIVRPFDEEDFDRRGFVKGYVGPQGFEDDVVVVADHTVRGGRDWITGANEPDRHVRGANVGRDFRVDRWEDVVAFREGDRCPIDGGSLRVGRSIVVGHIYQLGTKYSEPLGATFVDEDGTPRPFVMGCYGIGISRIVAAAAEQYHDELGLRWPRALAPFDVVVIAATAGDATHEAERIYEELRSRGIDAVLDDRDERAGVKFADADLIGYPVQVVVGARGLAEQQVDLKLRATGQRTRERLDEAAQAAADLLEAAP
ncbi:MAG: proline--tRNA ligase [Actinomycetota bacterium]|jgi:prolyl-tRNA synthetase|nr:MAG: proline--tRNA ligase [Actinomycetota bacterium]